MLIRSVYHAAPRRGDDTDDGAAKGTARRDTKALSWRRALRRSPKQVERPMCARLGSWTRRFRPNLRNLHRVTVYG